MLKRLKENEPWPSNCQGPCPGAPGHDFPVNQPPKGTETQSGGFSKSPSSGNLFVLSCDLQLNHQHLHN